MVADERHKRLEKEEEAEEANNEKELLKQTLRVVEEDCKALRRAVEEMGGRVPPDLASNAGLGVSTGGEGGGGDGASPASSYASLPPNEGTPQRSPHLALPPPGGLARSASPALPLSPSRRIPIGGHARMLSSSSIASRGSAVVPIGSGRRRGSDASSVASTGTDLFLLI
jgi:hypothetical protein